MSDDTKDLVERLRLGGPNAMEVSGEAADAIEAAQARIAELEKRYEAVSDENYRGWVLKEQGDKALGEMQARLAAAERERDEARAECEHIRKMARLLEDRCLAAERARDDFKARFEKNFDLRHQAERERDEALEQRDIWQEHHCCAVRERDEAREALTREIIAAYIRGAHWWKQNADEDYLNKAACDYEDYRTTVLGGDQTGDLPADFPEEARLGFRLSSEGERYRQALEALQERDHRLKTLPIPYRRIVARALSPSASAVLEGDQTGTTEHSEGTPNYFEEIARLDAEFEAELDHAIHPSPSEERYRQALIAIERSGLGSTARTIARAALSPTQPKGGE
jgi:hypothetical protein